MKITRQGFAVLDDDKDGLLSRWCEIEGLCHDGRVLTHYVPFIPEGGVVIDAGAAIGDHTVAYVNKTKNPRNVIAFEPNIEMFKCLQHNCPGVQMRCWALGEKTGKGMMRHNNSNAGASFISENGDYEVAVVALDDVFDQFDTNKLDFYKLDVEGMEVKALRGSVRTIEKYRPVIICECNPSALSRSGSNHRELNELFNSLGYSTEIHLGETDKEHYELLARPRKA